MSEDDSSTGRQTKRQRLLVTPELKDDISSVGCAMKIPSDICDDDDMDEEELFNTVEELREEVLRLLQLKDEDALISLPKLRAKVTAPRKSCSCTKQKLLQALSDESMKHAISKVIALFVESHSILGKEMYDHYDALLRIRRFIHEGWDNSGDLFLSKLVSVLRGASLNPPLVIYITSRLPVQKPCQPKHLQFDVKQRLRDLMTLSRSVTVTLENASKELLKQRLEFPNDDHILTTLEKTEARLDVLRLWTELLKRRKTKYNEDLDLYHDALQNSTSLDTMLWNIKHFMTQSK